MVGETIDGSTMLIERNTKKGNRLLGTHVKRIVWKEGD